MGLALAGLLAGIGAGFLLLGLGLVWAAKAKGAQVGSAVSQQTREPVTV
jgi:hypothetical protein